MSFRLCYATFGSSLYAAIKSDKNRHKNWPNWLIKNKENSRGSLLLWNLEVHAVPRDPKNKNGLDINHVILILTHSVQALCRLTLGPTAPADPASPF